MTNRCLRPELRLMMPERLPKALLLLYFVTLMLIAFGEGASAKEKSNGRLPPPVGPVWAGSGWSA